MVTQKVKDLLAAKYFHKQGKLAVTKKHTRSTGVPREHPSPVQKAPASLLRGIGQAISK